MNKKIINISFIKAISMLIVVLGHSMILYQLGWGIFTPKKPSMFFNNIKFFIDIIQMPLFVFVSGYLYYISINLKNKYTSVFQIIFDKFKRLMIPYIFFSMFWVIPIRFFVKYKLFDGLSYLQSIEYVIKLDVAGIGHLWFLPMIFNIFIIMFLLREYIEKYPKLFCLIFTFLNFMRGIAPETFVLKRIMQYLIYFYIGYLIKKYESNLKNMYNKKFVFLISGFLFAIVSFISYLHTGAIYHLILKLTGLISSILFILFIYLSTCNMSTTNKVWNFFDKHSFAIYLFHEPIIFIVFFYIAKSDISSTFIVLISFIISIIVSLLFEYILRIIRLDFILGDNIEFRLKNKKIKSFN